MPEQISIHVTDVFGVEESAGLETVILPDEAAFPPDDEPCGQCGQILPLPYTVWREEGARVSVCSLRCLAHWALDQAMAGNNEELG